MMMAEHKKLYRDLKSIASSNLKDASCDCQAELFSGWFSCPEEGSSSAVNPTQEKQQTDENCKLYNY